MAAGAVSLRKSHDIVILSLSNIVKGQANYSKICQKGPKSGGLFDFSISGSLIEGKLLSEGAHSLPGRFTDLSFQFPMSSLTD